MRLSSKNKTVEGRFIQHSGLLLFLLVGSLVVSVDKHDNTEALNSRQSHQLFPELSDNNKFNLICLRVGELFRSLSQSNK